MHWLLANAYVFLVLDMTLCAVCACVTVEENLPVCGGAAILKQLKSIVT